MEAGIWTWRVEVGAALLLSSSGTGIRVKRLQQWWRWGEQSSVADTSLLATPCQRMGAGGTWSRDQTWVSCRFLGEKGRLLGKAGDKSMRMELFWWKPVDGVAEPPPRPRPWRAQAERSRCGRWGPSWREGQVGSRVYAGLCALSKSPPLRSLAYEMETM